MSPPLAPLAPSLAPLPIANSILVFFLLAKPSLQAEECGGSAMKPEVVQSTELDTQYFPASNVLILGEEDANPTGFQANFWVAEEGKTTGQGFTIKVDDCPRTVGGFQIKNKGKGVMIQDWGTKDFRVSSSLDENGPWQTLVEAQLSDTRSISAPLLNFTFEQPVEIQFIKFELLSYWPGTVGGGLQYFAAIPATRGSSAETTADGAATTSIVEVTSSLVMLSRKEVGNPIDYFDKNFDEYKDGFESNGESWLGLEKLHQLTSESNYSLRITLKDFDEKTYVAVYDQFQVGPGDEYVLTVGGFNIAKSTLKDSMNDANGMKFTTKDKDQDKLIDEYNCAKLKTGGWWYESCGDTHLTGQHTETSTTIGGGKQIYWFNFGEWGPRGNTTRSWKEALMMLEATTTTEKPGLAFGTIGYYFLMAIPIAFTLFGLIYMIRTNCKIRQKCHKCCYVDLEKEDENLDYGTYYYADDGERRQDVMEVHDSNPAYESNETTQATPGNHMKSKANEKNVDPRSSSVDDYDYMGNHDDYDYMGQ